MKLQINAGNVQHSQAISDHLTQKIESSLKRWSERITRIEAHLHDENSAKGGHDKRCTLEIRLAGHQPLAVEADARDLYEAITEACGKAERAVEHRLEREQARRN